MGVLALAGLPGRGTIGADQGRRAHLRAAICPVYAGRDCRRGRSRCAGAHPSAAATGPRTTVTREGKWWSSTFTAPADPVLERVGGPARPAGAGDLCHRDR